MRPSLVLLGLLSLAAGCGVTRNRVVATNPDGSVVQEIDCRQDHPEKCQQRAQQLCAPFGRQPQILRPLVYEQGRDRWTTVITCGSSGPPGPAPMAGPPAPPPGAPPPAASMTPASGPPK